jgi:hypothetical protein
MAARPHFVSNRRFSFFLLRPFFAASVDIRVAAKLIYSKIGDEPTDLDQLLESMGLWLTWREKLQLLEHLSGVDAVYHAISGKLLVRRK